MKTIFALLLILACPYNITPGDKEQDLPEVECYSWIMAVDVSPTERWEYWHSAAGTVKKVVYY